MDGYIGDGYDCDGTSASTPIHIMLIAYIIPVILFITHQLIFFIKSFFPSHTYLGWLRLTSSSSYFSFPDYDECYDLEDDCDINAVCINTYGSFECQCNDGYSGSGHDGECQSKSPEFEFKPQSHQAYDQVTTYLRPKNGAIVERTYDWSQRSYDWSQRSWVIARGKSVAARSWSSSKPSHTGLTTRLRPTCDRKMLQSWANRRKNVRLVAEVVRLVAEVVGDRKGQISRNEVDGHVQNLKPVIPNRKRSHD